jgi:hypothetical protein
MDYMKGREDEKSHLKAVNTTEYTKFMACALEAGRFDITPSVAMFTGMPKTVTAARGHFAVTVLSIAECGELGTDLASAVRGLDKQNKNFEGGDGNMGMHFLLTEGASLWVPYGSCAILVPLCVKTEFSKSHRLKKVLAWPSSKAAKQTLDDYSIAMIDCILDTKAIANKNDSKDRMKAQMIMQSPYIPKSLKETDGFKAWMGALSAS